MKHRLPPLAAAITLFLPAIASAANATFNPGDILMGFRATNEPGNNSSYVVNLGPVAALRDAAGPLTLALGNLNADLTVIFGTNWRSRTDLFWGVAGTPTNILETTLNGDPGVTLYGSKVQSSPGVAGSGWTIAGSSTRVSKATLMTGLQTGFNTYQTTSNSSHAVVQTNSTDPFDWRAYMATGGDDDKTEGNKDFGAFGDIEALPANTLSLFRMAASQNSTYEGYFAIGADGVVTFTPESAALTYASWATTNAPGQTAVQDFDLDGIPNGVEFFMGTAGNAFTSNPVPVNGSVTWPRAAGRSVASFEVQISSDLGASDPWHTATVNVSASAVTIVLPQGMPRVFARLVVIP